MLLVKYFCSKKAFLESVTFHRYQEFASTVSACYAMAAEYLAIFGVGELISGFNDVVLLPS